MCNAWNHSASCNCGWGGVSYTQPFSTSSPLNKKLSQLIKTNANVVNSDSCEPKTYHAECWWCGELVFHHTNGNGDYVMFDSLGYPWQIHKCWEHYWESENEIRRILNQYYELTLQERKRLALKIVAASIPNVKVGELNIIYGAKESVIADKMNFSIEELRKRYGDVYDVNDAGEIILNSLLLENLKEIEQVLCYDCKEYVDANSIQLHRLYICRFRKRRIKY